MNSICISTDELLLPVLGLDIAKASVQAELRIKGRKVRFGFANNAKGFAQLARILEQQDAPKIWAGEVSSVLRSGAFGNRKEESLCNPTALSSPVVMTASSNKTPWL